MDLVSFLNWALSIACLTLLACIIAELRRSPRKRPLELDMADDASRPLDDRFRNSEGQL